MSHRESERNEHPKTDESEPCENCREEHRRHWHERVLRFMEHDAEGWHGGGRRFAALRRGGGHWANPLVALMLTRGGGVLQLLVLHLLSKSPRHGNELMREIAAHSQGTWASNPGVIYPMLRVMEHQDLVKGEWEDPERRTRRIYSLTEAGRKYYIELKDVMKPGLTEAFRVMQGLFDELYAEERR